MKTIEDIDVSGKKVLIRTDFNVPLDDKGAVLDDIRIKRALPTIKKILDKGAAQIIIMSHVGRPKTKESHLKTANIAAHLGTLLGIDVAKVDDWGESGLPDAKVVFLENLRFNPSEKSTDVAERDAFGKQLASLADYYVNEAFANCHRDHASMTSVPKFIPGVLGKSAEEEVAMIEKALEHPEKPVCAVIGGIKADKIDAIKHLLPICDHVLIGGALAFTMLKAKGVDVGNSEIDREGLKASEGEIKHIIENEKVHLPSDAVVADRFAADAASRTVSVDEIPQDWRALDIGQKTRDDYCSIIKDANTVFWFGPVGVFEFEQFAEGTKQIAQAIALVATSIVGGGDSGEAVSRLGLKEKMSLVASGGGAALQMIEGKTLLALAALEN